MAEKNTVNTPTPARRNRYEWRQQAACRSKGATFFGSPSDVDWEHTVEEAAKRVCSQCPVRNDCYLDDVGLSSAGVRGGANRWERAHIEAADETRAAVMVELHDSLGHEGCAELRRWWESTYLPSDSAQFWAMSEEEMADRWGVSPKVAAMWRSRMRPSSTRPRRPVQLSADGRIRWRRQATRAVLEHLADSKPRRRENVQDIIIQHIPKEIVDRRIEAALSGAHLTAGTSSKPINKSRSRVEKELANELLYFLGQKRRGLVTYWENDRKEQYVKAA